MKTLLISAVTLFAVGCNGGFALRDPKMYAEETHKVLEPKNNEIRACYDGVLKGTPGVGGKVTVTFDVVEAGAEKDAGKIANVMVDKANTTAPEAVSDCVAKTINGAGPLAPADQKKGQASFVYEFSAPAAPAAAAAPKS
jgi:hypothetical protein